MPKSAQAFRTIREVADWLDVAAHVLRFWESKFSQIKPVKRAGGRRYYRPADMELVGGIKVLLHDRGLTIRGVQKLIADEGLEAVTSLSPDVDALMNGVDVVEGDPSDTWEEDSAAEVAVSAPEAVASEDASVQASPAEDTPEAEAPVEEDAPAEDPPQTPALSLVETTPPEAAPAEEEVAEAAPEDAPTPEPVAAGEVEILPDEAPEVEGEPEAEAEVAAQEAPLPPPTLTSDPAEGPLGTLAAIARIPAAHRAALAPQIAALDGLRARMASHSSQR